MLAGDRIQDIVKEPDNEHLIVQLPHLIKCQNILDTFRDPP